MNLRIALTRLSEGNVSIRSPELALMHCLRFLKAIFCNGNISLSTTYKESLDHFCQLWVEVLLPKLDDDSVVAHMWADQSWLFGAETSVSLEDKCVQAIADAASEVNPDVIVLFHGHLGL
jgi:hypothetical protein